MKALNELLEKRDPNKCYIAWCWCDIQSLKPEWTEQKCQNALDIIKKQLKDRSIEIGWEIMEILLDDCSDEINEIQE